MWISKIYHHPERFHCLWIRRICFASKMLLFRLFSLQCYGRNVFHYGLCSDIETRHCSYGKAPNVEYWWSFLFTVNNVAGILPTLLRQFIMKYYNNWVTGCSCGLNMNEQFDSDISITSWNLQIITGVVNSRGCL